MRRFLVKTTEIAVTAVLASADTSESSPDEAPPRGLIGSPYRNSRSTLFH